MLEKEERKETAPAASVAVSSCNPWGVRNGEQAYFKSVPDERMHFDQEPKVFLSLAFKFRTLNILKLSGIKQKYQAT